MPLSCKRRSNVHMDVFVCMLLPINATGLGIWCSPFRLKYSKSSICWYLGIYRHPFTHYIHTHTWTHTHDRHAHSDVCTHVHVQGIPWVMSDIWRYEKNMWFCVESLMESIYIFLLIWIGKGDIARLGIQRKFWTFYEQILMLEELCTLSLYIELQPFVDDLKLYFLQL